MTRDYLSTSDSLGLSEEIRAAWDEGEFRRAGVGRGDNLTIREDVRKDHVMWLQESEISLCQNAYLRRLDTLREDINRSLFLGLMDFEGHFAIYPEGAFYKPHLDRHRLSMDRLMTVILYLNPNWQPEDGGELKIRTTPGSEDGPFELIEPRMGTMVCFLSGDHWHEVLPARKTRASITGWFHGRA